MQQRHMEIAAQREKAAEALRKIEGTSLKYI